MTGRGGVDGELLSRTDIALLTGVSRPVVSVWQRRYSDFPPIARQDGGRDLFRANEVADWLRERSLGNNPDAALDVALFALTGGTSTRDHFPAVTALLALRACVGGSLGQDEEELLEAAAEHDRADRFLRREVEALGRRVVGVSGVVDAVVEAARTPVRAVTSLYAARYRLGLGDHVSTAFGGPLLDLVASVVEELLQRSADPVLCDASGSDDLLAHLAARRGDVEPPRVLVPTGNGESLRSLRRRSAAMGWFAADHDGTALPGNAVLVAQFPTPYRPATTDVEIAEAVRALTVGLTGGQRAVVVGPASALCDAAPGAAVHDHRAAALRTGRVRAVVRLPAGSWTVRPRQSLALWVLDAEPHDSVGLADLSASTLAPDVTFDLVSDVLAVIDHLDPLQGRAYRFLRPVRRQDVAPLDDLLRGARSSARFAVNPAAAEALRLDALTERLTRPLPALTLTVDHGEPQVATRVRLGDLVADGTVHVLSGTRFPDVALPGGSTRVLSPADLIGDATAPRRVDRLALVAAVPAVQFTAPGDVVFCTSPAVGAVVDREGLSAVRFPARVLRIGEAASGWLGPEVVAQAVRAGPGRGPWRSWTVPVVPDGQGPHLERALREVRAVRDDLATRLAAADALTAEMLEATTTRAVRFPAEPDEPTDDQEG
ncbi:hypothetical protein AB2L28_05870 [Kineococcus sp. TBRC 1896]|uniref:Uncharacterized protein n=1 Tax=Kineococcus mangrovi TaxID=1660183 RepID=A0ABV4HZC3_9ACTN